MLALLNTKKFDIDQIDISRECLRVKLTLGEQEDVEPDAGPRELPEERARRDGGGRRMNLSDVLLGVGTIAASVAVAGTVVLMWRGGAAKETCWADQRPPHDAFETFLVLDGVPNLCRRLPPKSTSLLLHVFDGTEAVACYPLTLQECPK